jgi:hypothetical protein
MDTRQMRQEQSRPLFGCLRIAFLFVMTAGLACGACRGTQDDDATADDASGGDSGDGGDVVTTDGSSGVDRLQPSDLTYQGAFRLPDEFNWGARGMAYTPADTLLIIGRDGSPWDRATCLASPQAEFGEIAIPALVRSGDWLDLNTAAFVSSMTGVAGMRDFDGAIVCDVSEGGTARASGIEYVPARGSQRSDKIYGSLDEWYGVSEASHATVWMSELNGSNPRGPFHVGPPEPLTHGNKSGDFLFQAPRWYADAYLGGRILLTGKNRGAFNGSQGPTLLAFRPWDSEDPSGDLDAIPVLYYRIDMRCASPNCTDKSACDFPDYTFDDKWEGGAFLESSDGKSAVTLFGVKGLGGNYYGSPGDGTLDEGCGPSMEPASMCNPSQGYHADPFERQVIFYDVAELAAAAGGRRDPWTIVPYATWRPAEFFSQGHTCGETGGVAYDSEGRRVFVIEKGLGDDNAAVVHVWSVR